MEAASKPLVAAIEGVALGGGFELALACHWRIAATTAKVGLPEVKLGLLPGAGGTQRFTRLAGPEAALEAITAGHQIPAPRALELGLVDALADPALDGALAFARRAVAERRPLRVTSDVGERIRGVDPELFAAFRRKLEAKARDRKSTRLNSSHTVISYAVFCLKKKRMTNRAPITTSAPTPKARSAMRHHGAYCRPYC